MGPLSGFIVVTGVGTCIEQELINTPESGGVGAKMRKCYAVPGNIAWDSCDCGQLAQSIQQKNPTRVFPTDASNEPLQGGCQSRSMMWIVVASLTRCIPGMKDSGAPPTPAQLFEAARIQAGDEFAMRAGIECCLAELKRAYRIADFRVGASVFPGPEGNCGGVEITYSFQMM